MVSLRRRRYLGLCGGKSSFEVVLPQSTENGKVTESTNQSAKSTSVHPLSEISKRGTTDAPGESHSNASLNSVKEEAVKEESNQSINYYPGRGPLLSKLKEVPVPPLPRNQPPILCPDKEVKRRKRHRRKQYVDREPCVMRGVYFKNMKWQAAIKVDKKQIHLGTVGSQDEAARLYDRAAFMCGREPNFELSEEDKRELRKYTWEEFLEITRNTITTKRQRKFGLSRRKDLQLRAGSEEMNWANDGYSSIS